MDLFNMTNMAQIHEYKRRLGKEISIFQDTNLKFGDFRSIKVGNKCKISAKISPKITPAWPK